MYYTRKENYSSLCLMDIYKKTLKSIRAKQTKNIEIWLTEVYSNFPNIWSNICLNLLLLDIKKNKKNQKIIWKNDGFNKINFDKI